MTIVNPYLNFSGNCEEAFNYYKSVFGGEFVYVGRYKDMPPQEGMELSDEDKEKIMHISLPLSETNLLMGSDSGGEWASDIKEGNNISLSINTSTKADADHYFNSLSAGGKVSMPMSDTFWGDYFGMCQDKFGINWMISFNDKANKS